MSSLNISIIVYRYYFKRTAEKQHCVEIRITQQEFLDNRVQKNPPALRVNER